MTFQPAPLAAEIRAIFLLNGEKTAGFSMYSRLTSGVWTTARLNALCASLDAAILADYIPALSHSHSYIGVRAKNLAVEFGESVELLGGGVPGDLVADALPNQAAVVITWLGSPGSAPARGRSYLPSPSEAQVTGSSLTSGAVTALEAVATSLRAAVEDPSGIPEASQAIVSRYSGSVVVGTTQSGRPIKEALKRDTAIVNGVAGFRVGGRVDSQRKRMPREAA